jgi:hypothetical protein
MYTPVSKVTGISRDEFYENYLKPRVPVIFTDLAKDWKATSLWTFDYFREHYGHWDVPMYDSSFHAPGKGYMQPAFHKRFDAYLDEIEAGPTRLRFHNFQLLKLAPELREHYETPTIMDGFYNFALMFFGGKDARLNLHYDIDCSHVFLTHFQTRKKVFLYSPDQGTCLYKLPSTNHSHVDVLEPDLEQYPAFKLAKGMEADLEHGETLFIPQLWWHYVYYSEGGFSLSLRANDSIKTRVRGAWNLARWFAIDRGMNAVAGSRWKDYKDTLAQKNAERLLESADL